MATLLRTLFFFQVLICVTVKIKAQSAITGTEGGSVDIYCKYPDGYQSYPMYFCRDPCTDVIIQSEKADRTVTKRKYTAINTSSARSFSVTIRHLTLKDSGVYYCGVDKWGYDIIIKVKLTVSKAILPLSTHAPEIIQNQSSEVTKLSSNTTVIPSTADKFTSYEQTSSTTQTQHPSDSHADQLLLVFGGTLPLILCCVLAALVILYRKKYSSSNTSLKSPAPENQILHPPPDQEDIFHVYDEMAAVYSFAGPAIGDDSSATYSTIQLPATVDKDCNLYSLVY